MKKYYKSYHFVSVVVLTFLCFVSNSDGLVEFIGTDFNQVRATLKSESSDGTVAATHHIYLVLCAPSEGLPLQGLVCSLNVFQLLWKSY